MCSARNALSGRFTLRAVRAICGMSMVLVALSVLCGPRIAQGQFLGFDLPRPGRSLATSPPLAESNVPNPSVARVVVDERTSLSHGTGVLVAAYEQHALVLTNWHVVRDVAGPINVMFPSGFISPARIMKVDKDWDLAALGIWNPNAAPIPIAKTPPRIGDTLTIAGYGSGQYRAVTGRCSQYLSPGHRFPYEMIEVSVEARRGDSGGPILNQQGELAGVLFGASTGTTSGSHSGRVRRFVTPWIAMVDRPYVPVAAAATTAPPGPPPVPPTTNLPPGANLATQSSGASSASGAGLLTPQPGLGPVVGAAGVGVASGVGTNTTSLGSGNSHVAPVYAESPYGSPFAVAASTGPLPLGPDETLAHPNSATGHFSGVPIAGDSLSVTGRPPAVTGTSSGTVVGVPPTVRGNSNDAARWGITATSPEPGTSSPPPARTKDSSATPFDHAKNVLALLGVLALAFHLLRRSPPPPEEDDDD